MTSPSDFVCTTRLGRSHTRDGPASAILRDRPPQKGAAAARRAKKETRDALALPNRFRKNPTLARTARAFRNAAQSHTPARYLGRSPQLGQVRVLRKVLKYILDSCCALQVQIRKTKLNNNFGFGEGNEWQWRRAGGIWIKKTVTRGRRRFVDTRVHAHRSANSRKGESLPHRRPALPSALRARPSSPVVVFRAR